MTPAAMRLALPLACVVAALVATPAAAQRCEAPPGTAAVEQYCETVLAAGGARGAGRGAAPAQPVPARTLRRLEASGAQGRQLSELLQGAPAAAPARGTSRAAPRRRPARRTSRAAPRGRVGAGRQAALRPAPAAPANPLSAVRSALTGGETVGRGFPWVLLAIAAGMGAVAWLRRGRRHGG